MMLFARLVIKSKYGNRSVLSPGVTRLISTQIKTSVLRYAQNNFFQIDHFASSNIELLHLTVCCGNILFWIFLLIFNFIGHNQHNPFVSIFYNKNSTPQYSLKSFIVKARYCLL